MKPFPSAEMCISCLLNRPKTTSSKRSNFDVIQGKFILITAVDGNTPIVLEFDFANPTQKGAQTQRHTHLDINHGQSLFGSAIVSGHSVDRLRYVVQDQIQIHFIFLLERRKKQTKKL